MYQTRFFLEIVWVFVDRGVVLDWTCWSSPHGALKTRRFSRLDLWIVPTWSLKNEEVFLIEWDSLISVLLSTSIERVGVSVCVFFTGILTFYNERGGTT